MSDDKKKKAKKRNLFNSLPINPPKGWVKPTPVLGGTNYRMIPR
jgi:hypothetical protein